MGSGAEKRTHILVKPFASNLATNLVVTTDRRSYHLQLTATSRTAMAALSWTYPADQLIALRQASEQAAAAAPVSEGLSVDSLHFNYAISGDQAAWRPLRAFDDGRSEEHTSELQSLMRISYAVFCLKKKQPHIPTQN